MAREESFPRSLSPLERDLLLWLLPSGRPGYDEYRSHVASCSVVARGRRGEGNYILAPGMTGVDIESPLPQVFAYGIVETAAGRIGVTLRERLGDQLEFEIVNLDGNSVPAVLSEQRRWTFSTWLPNQPCPMCLGALREVRMQTEKGRSLVLALCGKDGRIWVHDAVGGVNHLIPVTNFYNELMLHANVRDPGVALNSKRLFTDLRNYSDATLSGAFATYNKLKTKIPLAEQLQISAEAKPSFFRRLRSHILKQY